MDNKKLLTNFVSYLNKHLKERDRLISLGVGYGLISYLLKDILRFSEAFGVDIDEERLKVVKDRGINPLRLDLESEILPFPDKHFDLVLSFGLLNHLKFVDNVLSEASRVLKPYGIFAISIPNLGWWINRLCLVFGFQPPDVEVSGRYCVGLPKLYPRQKSIEYVHTTTLRGAMELLELYGFKPIKIFSSGIPSTDLDAKVPSTTIRSKIVKNFVKVIDAVASKRASLSLRLFIVSQKLPDASRVKSK